MTGESKVILGGAAVSLAQLVNTGTSSRLVFTNPKQKGAPQVSVYDGKEDAAVRLGVPLSTGPALSPAVYLILMP